MILTGKSRIDYSKWFVDERETHGTWSCHHLIIEYFDSVGIYIQVGAISISGVAEFDYIIQQDNEINGMNGHIFDTRKQATQEAIKQANTIYNER